MADTEAVAGQVPEDQMRCGFIAVIGAPNAGKSTLVNALVGAKVTIVSRKVQTTRIPVRGIVVEGTSQLVFLDTPGIFRPRRRLDRAMVEAAWAGALDADIVVLLVDSLKGITEDVERILDRLGEARGLKVLVLNKVDRLADKSKLLTLTEELTKRVEFQRVFMVSALTGSGLKDLKSYLVEVAPPGPWHYPPDELSDLTDRKLAAEITREKIYERLHEELPYSITVETTDWTTKRDGSVRIDQTIYVERESQRKIVLGKGGATVKQISMEARKELAELLGHPVHLFLYVKVREDWAEDPERYREMGLEFPKE
ncbi:MAG TPA: GTPase Era [Hyphomicrobiaceae bacterium]|nr:GTPase Era [Hyphomicrobiaceae bacterium]